jgi:CPA2 family monovalent cation:H+ antiporter-2
VEHHIALIETIAIGLGAAFIGGIVARRFRLPAIVGYLLAGVAIGPYTPGLIADTETAGQLAELGVVLLMFGVGIHFSIPDLLSQRRIAIPGAIGQIVVATALGACLGIALGWGVVGGVVLGLAVSVASTVVLLRALIERGELDTQQGRIAVAWLIVEDLFTVAVLVLLPTISPLLTASDGPAVGSALAGLAGAAFKAVAFAAIMLFAGARLVPWVLSAVARERSRELFTLAVLAIAIGIAYLASALFGVSLALGAFLAGAVLSESDMSHQAAADAIPLRDAFAVIFFVSVGMLLDPTFLIAEWPAVVAITALVVIVKSTTAFAIVVAFGYPVRVGLTIAAALAQIGEFSFILATLGLTLGLIPEAAFQLVVAGALVSITLNPAIFWSIGPVQSFLRDHPRLRARLERPAPDLAVLGDARAGPVRGHAVLAGHGRVARMISAALARRGFSYIVISDDRREVERLRRQGVSALFGDAASPELLEAANAAAARVVIVAISDPHSSRLVVERTRALAPRVPLVVRTHGGSQASTMRARGHAIQTVHAEVELAVQMTRFSLRRFGVSAAEVESIATGLRGNPGVGEPSPAGPQIRFGGLRAPREWIAGHVAARRRRSGGTGTPSPRGRAHAEQLPAVEVVDRYQG